MNDDKPPDEAEPSVEPEKPAEEAHVEPEIPQVEPPHPPASNEPAAALPVSPQLKAEFPRVFTSERRQFIEDFTAHFIGIIFSLGFFAIILAALLGFVDINDPTVAAFVGTAIGYAAGKLDPVLSRYFGSMTTTGPTK